MARMQSFVGSRMVKHTLGTISGELLVSALRRAGRTGQVRSIRRPPSGVHGSSGAVPGLSWGTTSWRDAELLPLIDTLYQAPLAFPQRPYHALIKD